MVKFISDCEKDVIRINNSHNRRHQRISNTQNKDIFDQTTCTKDIVIFDIVTSHYRYKN